MRGSRVPSIAPGTFFVAQSWADCITNMAGFNLRQAQPTPVAKKQTKLRWPGSFESNPEPALAKREPTSVDEGKSD